MDISNIDQKYKDILSKTEPYILSFKRNWKHYNFSPWGHEIPEENRYDCISLRSADFTEMLFKLDGLAFGPMGMPMDKWVFFDCGEMPGGIFGFGVRAKDLAESALKEYGITADYKGLVPISMYITIPMACGEWFGHNLSSANRVLTNKLPGMGLLTKAMALKVFNIETLYGATQWDSKALNIHLQLADMDIESAYTPAHTFKNTMTYKSVYSDEGLLRALDGSRRDAPDGSWGVEYPPKDEDFSLDIQKRIESGERFTIVGRPIQKDGDVVYPVKQLK